MPNGADLPDRTNYYESLDDNAESPIKTYDYSKASEKTSLLGHTSDRPTLIQSWSLSRTRRKSFTSDGSGPKRKKTWRRLPWMEILTALLASFTPLSRGFVTGYTSPSVGRFINDGTLSHADAAIFGSLVNFGGVLSCFVVSLAMDRLGRRGTLIIAAVPQFLGWVCIAFGREHVALIIGRVLNGFGSAVVFSAFNIYIAETTHKTRRGALCTLCEMFISLGTTTAFLLGQFLSNQWLAIAGAALSACMFTAMLPLKESPRWLIQKGRLHEGFAALSWLRGVKINKSGCIETAENTSDFVVALPVDVEFKISDPSKSDDGSKSEVRVPIGHVLTEEDLERVEREHDVEREFDEIRAKLNESVGHLTVCDGGVRELVEIRRPLLVCLAMMLLQGMGGTVALVAFMQTIFEKAHFIYPGAATVAVGLLRIAATGTAGLLVDRVGRRTLLITGGLIQVFSLSTLATSFYLQHETPHERNGSSIFHENGTTMMTSLTNATSASALTTDQHAMQAVEATLLTYSSIFSIGLFLFAYSLGWGTVPSVVISELFPQRMRAVAGSVTSLAGLTTGTLCALSFKPLSHVIGLGGVFSVYATTGLIGVIFVAIALPETKNRSLEELAEVMT